MAERLADNCPIKIITIDDEMFQEMLKLQLEEDKKVHKEFGITYEKLLKENRYFYALLDELGELNHELKSEWCWWKKNVSQPDREKVLEEFSDVTHFVLSFCIAYSQVEYNKGIESIQLPMLTGWFAVDGWFPSILNEALMAVNTSPKVLNPTESLLAKWRQMIILLDLDFEKEVYEPYIKKNAINQKRVEEGY